MSFSNLRKTFSSWVVLLSGAVIVLLSIAFTGTLFRSSLVRNIQNRAFSELRSTAAMQATTLEYNLENQYTPLRVIGEMLANGDTFGSEEMSPSLEAVVRTHRLCMLGFADLDGNVTNYMGEEFGNIYDRAYFSDLVNGKAESRCEFLPVTKRTTTPRIMFSIPVYWEGVMIGVLFESKEVDVLEDSLFKNSDLLDTPSSIFICDEAGNVIVANDSTYSRFLSTQDTTIANIYQQEPELRNMATEETAVKQINLRGIETYAARISMETNHWSLYCVMDEASAAEKFGSNMNSMKQLVFRISLVFLGAMGYIVVLACIYIVRKNRENRVMKQYYRNFRTLLSEMNCSVLEYDLEWENVDILQSTSMKHLGLEELRGGQQAYQNYKTRHPEFSFDELEEGITQAKNVGKTYSLESIIRNSEGNIQWVRVVLVPIAGRENQISRVFCAVLDVTDLHSEFSTDAEVIAQIPSGIHRCYLSDPIHLEYFSEGLCKMLGYTHAEVEELVGPNSSYAKLIYPDDRPIFRDFVHRLAADSGVETCEYRMICKNGNLLAVSDTMDARRNSAGIMYGYSVVTDLSRYKELQEKLEHELAETRQQLEQARIKNSSSQMQPHFLYNALASIREIVLDDPEYASDLIYDFTIHLRACIKSMASDNLIPFSQELENIKAYINIEKMRFGERLHVEYDCRETEFDIIPLSIQPLVENAVRHGIYERGSAGGTVWVRTFRREDEIIIEIQDDGVGFDFDAVMGEVKAGTRDSTGLSNLIFRFEKLMKAKVTVQSEAGTGTTITVTIPIGGQL